MKQKTDKIKFGLLGCSRIGSRHANHINNNERAELVAVCDISKLAADNLAKEFNAKAFYDLDAFLKQDFDVVDICTPSGMHAEMTIDSLKIGKHVLCEKPMTLNLIDAERVVQAEKESGKKFFLVKQNRYNPPIQLLKDLVYKKKIGKINLINCNVLWNRRKAYYEESDWKGTMVMDGGALMTQCSHFLDLMLWIGGKVKKVSAKMDNLNHPYMETEDTGFITITFENGGSGLLQYTTCVYEKNLEGSMSVLGNKGSIKIAGEYLNKLEFWNVEGIEKPNLEKIGLANNNGKYHGSMSNHGKVIENVISVLLDGDEIGTNSLQGKDSIEVMQAAYISAMESRVVHLPLEGKDHDFKLNEQPPISGNKKSV